MARPYGNPIYPVYPAYPIYPGYWYPWYGPGFGYGYGYGYYDPWWYGGYVGYSGGYSVGAYSGGGDSESYGGSPETGSIRLKANVATAKVYIDGALMGTVDDFDGLSHHLDIAGGHHELELRADGYESHTSTVDVQVGKTVTERVTLNRKK